MANASRRYTDYARATMPGELPREGRISAGVTITHATIDDPNPSLRGKKQRAAVNRMTDGLEYEYSRKRISDAGYWAARIYQAVLERSRGSVSGGSAWSAGDRVDQTTNHEMVILNRIARAQDAMAMIQSTAPIVGMVGQRILEMVLIDGLTLGAAAARLDGSADRQHVIFWSETFRRCCEALADHWCSRGERAPRA